MTDRLARQLVRILLRLYPAPFRERYADDMEEAFADRWYAAVSAHARALLLVRSIANLLLSAAAERRRSSFNGSIAAAPVSDGAGGTGGFVASLLQDARYALRSLRAQPGFSFLLIATLAVGIGAIAAVFSVVDGVLLEPLPFPESDRLVAVWGRFDPESGFN
jgi:hypothetical protein